MKVGSYLRNLVLHWLASNSSLSMESEAKSKLETSSSLCGCRRAAPLNLSCHFWYLRQIPVQLCLEFLIRYKEKKFMAGFLGLRGMKQRGDNVWNWVCSHFQRVDGPPNLHALPITYISSVFLQLPLRLQEGAMSLLTLLLMVRTPTMPLPLFTFNLYSCFRLRIVSSGKPSLIP